MVVIGAYLILTVGAENRDLDVYYNFLFYYVADNKVVKILFKLQLPQLKFEIWHLKLEMCCLKLEMRRPKLELWHLEVEVRLPKLELWHLKVELWRYELQLRQLEFILRQFELIPWFYECLRFICLKKQ